MSLAQLEACPNCGASLGGQYCGGCGQKRFSHHDLTVRHFLSHAFHELTHLESTSFVRTLTALVFKPGLLTREYLAGRRSGYINPVRLYLSISAVFFLFAWGAMLQHGGTSRIERPVQMVAAHRHVDPKTIEEQFAHALKTYAAAARFTSALVLALFVQLLYARSKRYYVEHLIFSLHYISFSFLVTTCIELLRLGLRSVHVSMGYIPGLQLPVLFVYMFVALRVVYGQPRAITFFKAVALALVELGLFMASIAVAVAVVIITLLFT
jgi:Protein of unknown function (DUF3667)